MTGLPDFDLSFATKLIKILQPASINEKVQRLLADIQSKYAAPSSITSDAARDPALVSAAPPKPPASKGVWGTPKKK